MILYAIPSISSRSGFTLGTKYKVRKVYGWRDSLCTVLDDHGHEKVLGWESTPSAHLWDGKDWDSAGHFTFEGTQANPWGPEAFALKAPLDSQDWQEGTGILCFPVRADEHGSGVLAVRGDDALTLCVTQSGCESELRRRRIIQ